MTGAGALQVRGRAWVFGDQIDTDLLAPGPFLRKPLPELATHCLQAVAPDFASSVRPGDIVVGGIGFGIGSSREQAVQALAQLGVAAVLARGFARIFYRNALNLGLPAMQCEAFQIESGDQIELDLVAGAVHNLSRGQHWDCDPLPPPLIELLQAGGLMPWLARRQPGAPAA